MARVVVRDGRLIPDADPARVWALVANPERLAEWAPVHHASFMGTELPGVGHQFFLTFRRRRDPAQALRARIVDWEAGHRYRCELHGATAVERERVDVIVTSEVDDGRPVANLELRYVGWMPRWLAPWRRWAVSRILRKAVEGVERTVGGTPARRRASGA